QKNHCAMAALAGLPSGGRASTVVTLGLIDGEINRSATEKLGAVSEQGEWTIRRLPIIGATTVVHISNRRCHPVAQAEAREGLLACAALDGRAALRWPVRHTAVVLAAARDRAPDRWSRSLPFGLAGQPRTRGTAGGGGGGGGATGCGGGGGGGAANSQVTLA